LDASEWQGCAESSRFRLLQVGVLGPDFEARPPMSRIAIFCFFVVAWMGAPMTAGADKLVDDVPIPEDVRVEVPLDAPEALSRFSGAWVGSWGGWLHHILIVENISASGEARVVYAVGDNSAAGVKAQWRRHEATVSGNMLAIDDTFNGTYELTRPDRLRATYRRGDIVAHATLSRVALTELMWAPFVVVCYSYPIYCYRSILAIVGAD
jgi:hypothetical protein